MNTAVIIDEKSAADRSDRAGRHRPLQARQLDQGRVDRPSTSGTAIATRRRSRSRTRPSASSPIRRPRSAAMLAGDVDAFPRFANLQALDQFKSDPRFQVLIGGTEGKTILAINNKSKPLDDLKVRQAIAYAHRPQGDHRRRDERARRADRQPSDAQRSRLRRPHRPLSARPRQGEGAAQGGRRHDAARPEADPAAAGLTRARAARSSPPNSPRSASRRRSRTSNGRNGSRASTRTRTTI